MKITLQGTQERYLAETLCLLFFPAAKFAEDVQDGLSAHFEVNEGHVGVRLTAHSLETYKVVLLYDSSEDSIKRALARAMYKAGEEITSMSPPWGTLTGIRPTKLVRKLMNSGMTAEEASEYLLNEYYTSPEKSRLCTEVVAAEGRALSLLDRSAVSLYLGIPFCPTRCSYCSFVSHSVEREGHLIPSYVDALIEEIHTTLPLIKVPVSSIYIGGGTPTTLSPSELERVMGAVSQHVDLTTILEYTVEAGRPDTITEGRLAAIKAGGANRISVNTQTTNEDTLRLIGRQHTAADFFKAYEAAKGMDFTAINIDLIAGLPSESPEIFKKSLSDCLALNPENLTVHALSLKRAARLEYSDMARTKEDAGDIFKMLDHSSKMTAAAGLLPYYLYRQRNTLGNLENVGYSKEGLEGLYNVYIMGEYQSILALGCGGVSKVTQLDGGKIERFYNDKHVGEYLKNAEKRRTMAQNFAKTLERRIF